jgi:hypothetical protein
MTCETMTSTLLNGVTYALALVAGADETLSDLEVEEIKEIVQKPFFVSLAEKCGITSSAFADAIIKQTQDLVAAKDGQLKKIMEEQAIPSISETVRLLNGTGTDVILGAINSLANCDDLSEDETQIIAMIINMLDANMINADMLNA